MAPFFSIVMPSYLGEYQNAASNRKIKFRRAIDSVLSQTLTDFELIIVSDGCLDTIEIAQEYFDDRIKWFYLKKQSAFSGAVRNMGIYRAKGDYICYLDTDDYFLINHLEFLKEQISAHNRPKFLHFADNLNSGELVLGKCGTSNICHDNDKRYYWPDEYEHDWRFIHKFFFSDAVYVGKGGYIVCHVPGIIDN